MPLLPSFREDHISQVPALQLLQNIGYTYLSPGEALELRGGRLSAGLLESVLTQQLRKINRVRFKGNEFPFSEGNILSAVQSLKDIVYDGLVRTNEKVYDLLCLGRSMQQAIDGDTKSFHLQYIDWNNWRNNVFHVTEEFTVERSGSHETRRPDFVLFVNGIPFVVIECKRPDLKEPIEQAISQQNRNQHDDEIPHLFSYSQLLMVLATNSAQYATTGSPFEYWAVWRERGEIEAEVARLVNSPLSTAQKDTLFSNRFKYVRSYFDHLEKEGRQVTEQDRALYCLCRPERLLELTLRYTVFDNNERKIARYQQYFCVKKVLNRIGRLQKNGARAGGVVWHTQGSGKSLTMVMLAEAIGMDRTITNPKIVLVTDRVDLDDQIYKTFSHCGAEPVQAKTGRHLSELLTSRKTQIVTTVIAKFMAAVSKTNARNDDPNIFVLVDESHRTQFGGLHAQMKKTLPNACFIGFTGTPIMKKDRNTVEKFGGMIDTYTIDQAVKDKAVVPLLYEGRHVEQMVDKVAIDAWFERVTEGLSQEQRTDLKRKFASTEQLNKTDKKIERVAYDICDHFRRNWQGTGYKAQLVTPNKATALAYKRYLDEFKMVTSEVLVSAPDDREGEDDPDAETKDVVKLFWKRMMAKHGSEKEYNRQVINAFKNSEAPEIIIVVDKLLTGFDAPRNTVLYLTRMLKGHTLLQAIARVNRLFMKKDFGYIIDYRGVLQNLDEALDIYGNLAEFEKAGLDDLCQALTDVSAEIANLPQRHSDLLEVFKSIRSSADEEEYEQLLADEKLRDQFYDRLSIYARTLAVALSSATFLQTAPDVKVKKYKGDLRTFVNLRNSVRRRYAETVDFKEYEARIQNLLDKHVGTGEVEVITPLVNIFDVDAFSKEVEKLDTPASKADTIAYRTKKTIHERMQTDPAFYHRFSEMLEAAIAAFRAKRLSDLEYLKKVVEIEGKVRNRTGDDVPRELQNHDTAKALYGSVMEVFKLYEQEGRSLQAAGVEASLQIDEIISKNRIVNWVNNIDIQNRMKGEIEDFLFDLKDKYAFPLSLEDMDKALETVIEIAKVRCPA